MAPLEDHSESPSSEELRRIRDDVEADEVREVDELDERTTPPTVDDGRLAEAHDRHGNAITLRYSERTALQRAQQWITGDALEAGENPHAFADLIAEDLVNVIERIGRIRKGPISRGDAEVFAGPDADAADGGPLSLTRLRDTILEQLDIAVRNRPTQTPLAQAAGVGDVVEIGRLASAARDVDEILSRIPLDTAKPVPPFDVDEVCGQVWNAVQEAGAPTAASDAAVDTILKAAERRA